MIRLTVNGRRRRYDGPPFKRLLDVLREDFGLTGSKEGCGEGECGACTVLIDGEPVNACLVPVGQAEGARVETVEGLARGRSLGRLQQAFLEHGGAQCGICTPGMLMAAEAHRRAGGGAEDGELRRALAGNLCRCTGYRDILSSAAAALGRRRRRA
ncbi:MAG: (2Fe-2S)-binding protein [Elusimicrobia bacterium]|nr:(2Fe-2S)-binding protein [Elusimicrobiota bacterium]